MINIAIAAGIVVMLLLFKRPAVAAPVVAPSQPIDPTVPRPPHPVISLAGVTLTGSASAPLTIAKANIIESDFTGMLKPGTLAQLTPTSSAVTLQCIGARWGNLGRCKGPGGNDCDPSACGG